jgi:hypothetical protein
LDVAVTCSARSVTELVEELETGRFDSVVFCCESESSESKMRMVCKRLKSAEPKMPIFVLKSSHSTDSVLLTGSRMTTNESKLETIAQVLEKLRQVSPRKPQCPLDYQDVKTLQESADFTSSLPYAS